MEMGGKGAGVGEGAIGREMMRILIAEEIGSIEEDGFDGSEEEHRIFMNVFYGTAADCGRSNCGASRDVSDGRIAGLKRKGLSPAEDLGRKNKEPRYWPPCSSSNLAQPDRPEVGRCRIVESFDQGILSSYCRFDCGEEEEEEEQMDCARGIDGGVVSDEVQIINRRQDGDVVVEAESAYSPASHESLSSGLLATSIPDHKEAPEPLTCTNQYHWERGSLNSVNVTTKREIIRNLPDRLQSQAHGLLLDAGWKIEPRKRSDRAKLASNFISPEGGHSFHALSQAWRTCGESLLADAWGSHHDEDVREWRDIDVFWSDLADVLAYVEKENQPEKPLSLVTLWRILDPFMAVVCIDKRISALREGKALRALRSAASFLFESKSKISTDVNITHGKKNHGKKHSRLLNSSTQSAPQVSGPKCSSEGACTGQGLGIEAAQQLQNRRRYKQVDRELSSSGDMQNPSLQSLAVRMGKGLITKRLHSINCKDLLNLQREVPTSQPAFFPKVSCSSSPTDNFSPQGSRTPNSRMLSFNCLKPASDRDNNVSCNLDSSVNKEFDRIAQEEPDVDVKVVGKGASKAELPPLPGTKNAPCSVKMASHRPKRISEIETTEESENCMKVEVNDGKNGDEFRVSMASGTNNRVDLLFQQEEDSKFSWKTTPECMEQSACIKRSSKAANASKPKREWASPVTEASCTTKEPERSTPKAARNSDNDKRSSMAMNLEDETGGTLLNADRPDEDMIQHKPMKALSSKKTTSMSFSHEKVPSNSKKARSHCMHFTESVVADDVNTAAEIHCESNNQGMFPAIDFPDPPKNKKNSKAKKLDAHMKNGRKKPRLCRIDDDDLLISAIIKNKDITSGGKQFASKVGASQLKALRKLKSQKGSCRLLLRTPGKSGKQSMDGKRFILEKKTVLCWLIDMGALSIKEIFQYRNPKNNEVLKDGWVTRDGILCKCCTNILSVSEFKAHAGFKLHKPTLNLFVQSGKPYTICQLEAWSSEYRARISRMHMGVEEMDENDDTCGLCGDGGELICCDNCPSTYHQACLSSQEIPEGSWYCSNCICKTCGDVAKPKDASCSLAVLECSQCKHKYHDNCIKERAACNIVVGSGVWFCKQSCHEVYLGLRSRVGVLNNIGDEISWTILRCSHDDQKVRPPQKIAAMAECNMKLAVALNIMEECFLPMVDPRTGIDMIPHVLYNWGSIFARLNYQGFYTVILEKGDNIISVASIRVHGVTVAEMPLIATSSEYRRQGMCRRLILAIEKMLISFKVKMLVLSAIPDLVDTWTSGFAFKPIDDDDKQQLKDVNLMLFPGTSMLKKDLCEATPQESGLTSTSSSGNAAGDSDLYQFKVFEDFDEKASFENWQQPVEHVRIERDELPVSLNMPGKQAVDEQIDMLASCESPLPVTHSEHDFNSAEFFNVQTRTSNLYEKDQLFSTEQAVATVMSVANIDADIDTCFGSFSPASNSGFPSDPGSDKMFANIEDMGDAQIKNSNILVEDKPADATNEERRASNEGFEDENKEEISMLQKEKLGSLSYEQNKEQPFTSSPCLTDKNHLPHENSSISQDEICGAVVRHVVPKGFSTVENHLSK